MNTHNILQKSSSDSPQVRPVKSFIPSYSTCLNFALLYSTASLYWHWDTLAQCHCPMHLWLMILYASICGVQGVSHVGSSSMDKAPGTEQMKWYMHRSTPAAQTAFKIIAVVLLPFVAFWSFVGARWFALTVDETPECFPAVVHLSTSFFVTCIAAAFIITTLCSMFALHIWQLGGSLKRGIASIKAIQDADMLHRWGQISVLDVDLQGMSADCIAALPSEVVGARSRKGNERSCPICLQGFLRGEKIRRLPGCQHCFHRPCVDLWLVRNGHCPMCKIEVRDVRLEPEPSYSVV